ncbi:histidine kinase [Streptomyces sp. NPDC005774]|uniref:sensor histidine kinase n=1 Tax=Streptomyces sp. NPDC005774 TaxID=3364728 RepID=UPI0036811B74
MWPARRIVGESLLSSALALLAMGLELLDNGSLMWAVGVGLAIGLLSPLRRVLPATVLLATAVGSAVISGLTALLLVAAWSAGRRIGGLGRASGVFALAYALAFGSDLWNLPHYSLSFLTFGALLVLVMIFVPGLAGRYWAQRRTLADILGEYRTQLLREREIIAEHARIRERQRIAHDMHDSLGHQLALIAVHTGALEVDPSLTGRQHEAVGVLREASVAAMHELRDVVGVLRDNAEASDPEGAPGAAEPDGENPTPRSRGVAGIDSLVETSRKAGTPVELLCSGEAHPLNPTAGHAAYRLVQEGLTNAHKHAPGASITVGLRYEPDSLVVEVANGPAVEPAHHDVASGGQGLTGLGERARLVGGMVHAGPTEDGGFRLAGVLPYTSPGDGFPKPAPGAATTTFVARTDDFRAKNSAGLSGQSDPVLERIALPKELAKAMSRNKTRNGVAVGCGVAALAVLLLAIAAVVGVVLLFREADKSMIEPKEYDAIKVGQSETEVRDRLPDGDSFLAEDLEKDAPPVPAGAECLSLLSTEVGDDWDTEPAYRFCFKDGKLIEKKTFEAEV